MKNIALGVAMDAGNGMNDFIANNGLRLCLVAEFENENFKLR